MNRGDRAMFARRGKGGPGLLAVLIVIALAFAAGIGVGWGTGLVGAQLAQPEPTVSPSPSVTPSATPTVSLPPLEPITRELDDADRLAGLTTLDVPTTGEGTFSVVSGEGEPSGDAVAVKWVRVDVEDGVDMDGRALSQFVLAALDDPRGWGARGRYEFVPTEGASDIRIVIASPATAAALCPHPHRAASIGAAEGADGEGTDDAAASPSAEPSPGADEDEVSCADRGVVAISQYDWAAGLDSYGDERTASRVYQVNHGVGHVLGDEDGICVSGRALIMTDQRDLAAECEVNPWPYPDEPLPDPSPTPTATPAGREVESR